MPVVISPRTGEPIISPRTNCPISVIGFGEVSRDCFYGLCDVFERYLPSLTMRNRTEALRRNSANHLKSLVYLDGDRIVGGAIVGSTELEIAELSLLWLMPKSDFCIKGYRGLKLGDVALQKFEQAHRGNCTHAELTTYDAESYGWVRKRGYTSFSEHSSLNPHAPIRHRKIIGKLHTDVMG